MSPSRPQVVALSGGVGGAKLVHGLARILPNDQLTVVVNTGDDFEHLGLFVCPDLDTCMYTLAGLSDESRGWGLQAETFHALAAVERYGGPSWFQLGDRDLATHILRTEALRLGERLTDVTARLCRSLEVAPRILPMADTPRRTMIDTVNDGALAFQDWLVRRRAAPAIHAVRFEGADEPSLEVMEALRQADIVVLCPSNPYVSLDPILTLRGVTESLVESSAAVVAVSPLVHGRAIKGPLADMVPALENRAASAAAIADRYASFLDAMIVESGDERDLVLPHLATSTIMRTHDDRERLAREALELAMRCRT